MEGERLAEVQQPSLDIISTLPKAILETILCHLPIAEAARTSILSRKWRYKWTRIPKLSFDWSTVQEKQSSNVISHARKKMDRSSKLFYAIHQVMLLRQGPIHDFTLCMDECGDFFEIDQIILHLSMNHSVKKLAIAFGGNGSCLYKLPSCVFSLHLLKGLFLQSVDLDHLPILSGFGSLRKLWLFSVKINTKALRHLLSNCPSLRIFEMEYDTRLNAREVCNIIELFECLPMIKYLSMSGGNIHKWLVLDSIPKEFPTSLIRLKHFHLSDMCFADNHGLTFLVVLIKCSPNLETLRLQARQHCENEMSSAVLIKYSNVRLEHLKELKIERLTNFKPEIEFVKFILARSPKLKKVCIVSMVETNRGNTEMLNSLLQAPHASLVEFVVEWNKTKKTFQSDADLEPYPNLVT